MPSWSYIKEDGSSGTTTDQSIAPGRDPHSGFQVIPDQPAVTRYSETPPTPTPTPTPSTPSRYATTTSTAYGAGGAQDATALSAAEEERIRSQQLSSIQPTIDSINEMTATAIAEAKARGAERTGQGRALSAATGTLGSPVGDTRDEQIYGYNAAEQKKIKDDALAKIAGLRDAASQRADAIIMQTKKDRGQNSADYLAFLKDASTKALADMKALSATGTDLDAKTRQHLIDQTGYDGQTFDDLYKSMKIANSNDYLNKDNPEIIGNKAVFFKRNIGPDGKMTITQESLDLPDGGEIKQVVSRDDGIYVLYTDGSYKKLGAPSSGYVGPGGSGSGYNGEFAATVSRVAQQGGTNAQRAQIQKDMQEFLANGDYKSAYSQVVDSTAKGLGGTVGTDFRQRIMQSDVTAALKDSLTALHDAGYDTNKLTGGADKIQTTIGLLLTDPKYASAATQVDLAFQAYRQVMTGAAFGAKESAEYGSVLPSKGNSFALNMAKIDGLESYLRTYTNSYIKQVVGEGGVYIRDYAEGATPPAADSTAGPEQIEYNGVIYEKSGDQWIPADEKKNDGVSLNVPQRNNNPGNVKAGGIADQYAAKNPDGSPKTDSQGHLIFPSPSAGTMALRADIGAKISGNSRWLGKDPTIAELGDVYAEDPNWPKKVASILGVNVNTKASAVNKNALINAIMKQEGYFA